MHNAEYIEAMAEFEAQYQAQDEDEQGLYDDMYYYDQLGEVDDLAELAE